VVSPILILSCVRKTSSAHEECRPSPYVGLKPKSAQPGSPRHSPTTLYKSKTAAASVSLVRPCRFRMATGRGGRRCPSPPRSPMFHPPPRPETSIGEISCPVPVRSPNPVGARRYKLPAFYLADRANQKFTTSKANPTDKFRMSEHKYTRLSLHQTATCQHKNLHEYTANHTKLDPIEWQRKRIKSTDHGNTSFFENSWQHKYLHRSISSSSSSSSSTDGSRAADGDRSSTGTEKTTASTPRQLAGCSSSAWVESGDGA